MFYDHFNVVDVSRVIMDWPSPVNDNASLLSCLSVPSAVPFNHSTGELVCNRNLPPTLFSEVSTHPNLEENV
jgi:hypothetical protein